MAFSPLQVGYIANTVTPVQAGDYVKTALDLFEQRPDLEAVPVAGEDGEALGMVSRKITANFAVSAVYRGYQRNLKDFLIPFRGTLEGRFLLLFHNHMAHEIGGDYYSVPIRTVLRT
jgi:hypothetical protein